MHHLHAGCRQQRLHDQVAGRARAARGIGQLACPGGLQHVLDGLEAEAGVADQGLREPGGGIEHHDGIAGVADVLVDMLVDGEHRVHGPQPGVAVGRGAGDLGSPDIAVGPGPVFHDYGLSERLLHGCCERAHGNVGRAGGRRGNDDAYGLGGPAVGSMGSRQQQRCGRQPGQSAAGDTGARHGVSCRFLCSHCKQ
ncbi:hypothetical protein SDC9_169258 [bioreactor metagenome]|uniref:Uncharacterized protein n=1 Tax=bioreactor metagenome TaxID=1076179 RepID=A0A645G6U6_9ZZZZ